MSEDLGHRRAPKIVGYGKLKPLTGGHSYELFLGKRQDAQGKRRGKKRVLRVYGAGARNRGPEASQVEAAVLKLCLGLIPVPKVVEVRRRAPHQRTGDLLVMSRLPGIPLADVLTSADDELQRHLGEQMGTILGRLSNMAFLGPGCFLDGRLSMGPWPEGSESLITWLEQWRHRPALAQLPSQELDGLFELAAQGDSILAISPRAVLVHGDLSPRNVLCDPETGQITGLIDWEFAHAGHPAEDVGHLLRQDLATPYSDALLRQYNRWLPPNEQASVAELRLRARAADLYWLIEIGSRRGEGTATYVAHRLLRILGRTRQLLGELSDPHSLSAE